MEPVSGESKLSIGIMVRNEAHYFARLLAELKCYREAFDEIVIVFDELDDATLTVLKSDSAGLPVRVFKRHLNKNFAAQRNFLKARCQGRYILILDPDETPPTSVMKSMSAVLAMMDEYLIDACVFPRANRFAGVTEKSRVKKKIRINEHGWINWPDYQTRLLRNKRRLCWINRVHERPIWIRRLFRFPAEAKYAILHDKTELTYRQSQIFYETIRRRHFYAWRWRLLKQLGVVREEGLDLPPPC